MKKKHKSKRSEKWEWIIDLLMFVPELIIIPIRLAFRGAISLLRYWN